MIDIRLGNHHNTGEQASRELIDAIKQFPGSCDTVWFATEYGYPSLEKHRKIGEKIKGVAQLYRDAGIKVSLQISNTIGHGEYMKSKDNSAIDEYGFEKIVGPDGTVSDYSFCWRGENFIDYLIKSIEAYMDIKPATVWIDDDMRARNHAPVLYGCYCDNCIRQFNEQYGFSYTREALVNEINRGDVSVREKYVNFIREGMYNFVYRLSEAIIKASPETQLAQQYAREGTYNGMDYNFLFDAMHDASGKNVKSRPGGGVYDDKTPMRILKKMFWIGYSNSVLPDFVNENYPEIENLPDVPLGKSIYGTIKESTLDLAYGCNGLTYAVLMTPYEKIDFHKKMLRAFSEYKPYWTELTEHNRGTKNGGALVYEAPKAYLRELKDGEKDFAWENDFEFGGYILKSQSLMFSGMPITLDKDGGSLLVLSEGTVDAMRNDDIEDILTKPVLIDGPGFKKIIDRGYAWAFEASAEIAKSEFGFREVFTDHPVNKGFEGMPWSESFFTGIQMQPHVINGEGLEPLGQLSVARDGSPLGTSCAIVNVYDKNKNVVSRWAVFGYCIWKDILSSAKRQQIIYAADYICGNTLPAILESAEQVVVLPRVDKDKMTVSVTLCNASIGKTDEMTLRIRNPKGNKFVLKNADISIDAKTEKDGDDILVTVPSLGGWDIITLFIK